MLSRHLEMQREISLGGMHDPWRMFGLCFSMCRKGLICVNEVKNPEIKDQK